MKQLLEKLTTLAAYTAAVCTGCIRIVLAAEKKQRRAGSGGLEDKGDRSDKFRNMAGYSYLTPHIADAWRRLTETGWSRIGRF